MTRALLAAGALAAILAGGAQATGYADHTRLAWKPCASEDAPGPCVWDARHRGNGVGQSFLVTRTGEVRYVSHTRAHRLVNR